MRLYGPEPAALSGDWSPPALKKARHMEVLETSAKTEPTTDRGPGRASASSPYPTYVTWAATQRLTASRSRPPPVPLQPTPQVPPADADMQKIAALGLKTDFDFRTAAERQPRPDELPEGVKEVWLDVLADADDAGPAQLEQLMKGCQDCQQSAGRRQGRGRFRGFLPAVRHSAQRKKAFSKLFMAVGDEKQLCGTQSYATFSAGRQIATSLGFTLRFSGC